MIAGLFERVVEEVLTATFSSVRGSSSAVIAKAAGSRRAIVSEATSAIVTGIHLEFEFISASFLCGRFLNRRRLKAPLLKAR